jgi:hypothetical protein
MAAARRENRTFDTFSNMMPHGMLKLNVPLRGIVGKEEAPGARGWRFNPNSSLPFLFDAFLACNPY